MLNCLDTLDLVLALSETEYNALVDGDLDIAEHLCEERDRLMLDALGAFDSAPQSELCDRLLALQNIQQKLREEAARQKEELRGQLYQSKQESRRLNGYRKCVSMARA